MSRTPDQQLHGRVGGPGRDAIGAFEAPWYRVTGVNISGFIAQRARCTEGGEALAHHDAHLAPAGVHDASMGGVHWYALWTASHCERLVRDQLAARGYTAFLPEMQVWSTRRGTRRLVAAPMFDGYLFLRHAMTKESVIDVRKARGLVRILGERWDRLATVPDAQIDAIFRVHEAQMPALPHPFLQAGHRVRITSGPLAGVEGTMLKADAGKGLLVLSVSLLQRSVAVQVDCTCVTPVWPRDSDPHREAWQ